jgi:hypothetical protein
MTIPDRILMICVIASSVLWLAACRRAMRLACVG